MTPDEAAQLLARCAAFDNRQPSQIAKQAWAAALHDVPLDDDALAAVARYYGTPPPRPGDRLWIQPADVRTLRKAIRAERLDDFVYVPVDGDDNPRVYLAAVRQQREAVASGRRPANPEAVRQLDGGPHPTVARELPAIGRDIPAEREPDPEASPLSVPCPKCAARLGHHCRWPNGNRRPTHGARKRTARGEPATDPQAAAEEQARREAAAQALANLTPERQAQLDAERRDIADGTPS